MVIDYHNLNDQTVKNNYSHPLIIDLIDNIDIINGHLLICDCLI